MIHVAISKRKKIHQILLSALLLIAVSGFFQSLTAQQDFTGSFNTFLFQEVLNHMPVSGSNGYQPPTEAEINDFGLVFQYMKNGQHELIQPILDQYGYVFLRFNHTAENPDTFYLIYEPAPITRGWGMYVLRPNYSKNVHVQVPHPLFDTNTPQVGARSFVRHRMRYYSIAGAHRFANGEQGTNPVSDVARNHPSIFQRVHQVWSDAQVLQLHGFNDSNSIYDGYPDVVISNGTLTPPPILYTLRDLLNQHAITGGVFDAQTQSQLSLLGATQNPQGQWSAANGRVFIHYEMARFIRELGVPSDMNTPINRVISTFGEAFPDPQTQGTFFVGQEGTAPGNDDPDFPNLREMFIYLSSRQISGDVNIYITSDIEESQNVFVGLDTNGYRVTVKPYPGLSPVITFSAQQNNSSVNGALVIGVNGDSWEALRRTVNVHFDGSNAQGSTERNLTLRTASNAGNTNYFRILNSDQISFSNLNIEMNQPTFDAVLVTNFRRDGIDFVNGAITFDNVLVQNETRSSARSIIVRTAFDEPQVVPGLLTIRNSELRARRYGFWIREFGGSASFHNNDIYIHETDGLSARGVLVEQTASNSVTVDIFNNTFHRLSSNGQIFGIELASKGTMNVYNNMLTGFENNSNAAVTDFFAYGILVGTPDGPMNNSIYFNTILMSALNYTGGTGWRYRGIQMNSSANITADIRNNIVILEDENPEVTSYGLFRFLANGSWNSDFNNIFVTNPSESANTFFGRWGGSDGNVTTLAEWQNISGQDASSVSKHVEFFSPENLRLTGDSDGDQDLAGTPISGITTDIDGNERDLVRPYMGAFEGVSLSTNIENEQQFPESIQLFQNYPNPFNPVTVIEFELSRQHHVQLEVFDILGRRVALLVNETIVPGRHSVRFDASGLSSGIYIYKLTVGSESVIKRMTLLK